MTKKDYELIERAFAYGWTIPEANRLYWVLDMLTALLEKDNPKFDRNKFLQGCGIADEKPLTRTGKYTYRAD